MLGLWAQVIEVANVGSPNTCIEYADRLLARLDQSMNLAECAKQFHAKSEKLSRRILWGKKALQKVWSDQAFNRPFDPSARTRCS